MRLIDSLPFPPRPDESARGLVVRLAADNLCTSRQMCDWLGLPGIDSDLDVDAVPAAAAVVGMEPDALARMGFSGGGTTPFLGHDVPRKLVERRTMKVCPACLADAPYHRRIWEHRQIAVCPIHRTRLLHRCPTCSASGLDRQIRWTRQAMLVGDCGHDLAAQPAPQAGECHGAAAAYRRCGMACDGPELPAAFADLPLQALLDVLFFLGRMDVVIAAGNPDRIERGEMLTDDRLLEAGACIALGWPESFDGLAKRVRASHPADFGFARQYGRLHRFVARCGGEPYAAPLRDAYGAHLAGRGDVSEKDWPMFLEMPRTVRPSVSVAETQVLLGLGPRQFAALERRALWADSVPVFSPSKRGKYARSDVLAFKAKLDRLVTPHVLDVSLGIGHGHGTALCDAGLIPSHHWTRHGKKVETRSVDMADAEAMLHRLERLVRPLPPDRPLSFTEVVRRALTRRVLSFADVMRCILSGQLRGHVADPRKPGLAAMAFEEAEVVRVLDDMAAPSQCGKMCLADVARRLHVGAKGVRRLVEMELLARLDCGKHFVFDTEAVKGFGDAFVSDAALARRNGMKPDTIRETLSRNGAKPIAVVPFRRKATSSIYRSEDVAAHFACKASTRPVMSSRRTGSRPA